MIPSSLLPSFFRGGDSVNEQRPLRWGNRTMTSILQFLSRTACLHPIHTIWTIAILASTTYIGFLKYSFFHAPGNVGETDWGFWSQEVGA